MKNGMCEVRVPPRSEKMLGRFVVVDRLDVGRLDVVRVISMTDERVVYQVKEGPDAGRKFHAKYDRAWVNVYDRMRDALEHSRRLRMERAA